MKNSTIVKSLLVALSIGFAIVLFNLPKVVVENKEQVVQETKQEVDLEEVQAHSSIDTLEQRIIASLKKEMSNSEDLENYINFADSLCEIYRKQTKFDSLALVKEDVAERRKDGEAILDVANAWFDAFETIGGNRQIEYGENSDLWFDKLGDTQFAEEAEVKQAVLSVKLNALKGMAPMEGIRKLKVIVEKKPDNILARRYLGEFYLQVSGGDVSKLQTGITHFEHILKVSPNDMSANLSLVEAYIALPNASKAKYHLDILEKNVGEDEFFKEFIESKRKEIKSL